MNCRSFVLLLMCAVFSAAGLRVLAAAGAGADETTLSHLQQIGQACLIYANENKGYLPTTFGQIAGSLKKPEAFLDARGDSNPPADWEKMTADQQRDFVNAHCEFDFTSSAGQKIFRIKNPSTVPLAVTKDKAGRKKVTLFVDGRAQVEGSGKEPASLPPPPTTKP